MWLLAVLTLVDLSHVINYTFPESADVYVHRTGRTARAGKSGVALSLVSPKEIGSFYQLKLIHKIYPVERQLLLKNTAAIAKVRTLSGSTNDMDNVQPRLSRKSF